MADYLTLRNPQSCPVCRCRGRVHHFGKCPNCGTLLFTRLMNFDAYEQDGNERNWWLYQSKQKGWMHRDHVMVPEATALEREVKVPKLPDDYGRQTTPEAIRERGGKLRLNGKQKPRKRIF